MWIFERAIGKNFGPFKHIDLNLRSKGMVQVLGRVLGQEGTKSNGAGKTSIWDLIPWVLEDETTKKFRKDEVIRDGSSGTYGKLLTTLDGKPLKIIRGRGHKKYENKLWVWFDGKEEHRPTDIETREFLRQLTGYNFTSITNSFFFPQKVQNFFAALTDTHRKALLEQMMRLEVFSLAKKRASEDKKEGNKELANITTEMARSTAALDQIEETVLSQERLHKEWLLDYKDKIKEQKQEIKDKKKELKETKTELAGIDDIDLKGLQKKISKVESNSEKSWEKYVDARNENTNLGYEVDTDIPLEIAALEVKLKNAVKSGTTCNTCGQKVAANAASKLRKGLKVELGKVEKKLSEQEKVYAKSGKKEKTLSRKATEARETLSALRNEYQEQTGKQAEISSLKQEAKSISKEIEKLKEDLSNLKNEEPPFKKLMDYQVDKKKKLKKELFKLDDREFKCKAKIKTAEFWEAGFGDSGLKNILLESALAFLEQEITQLLSKTTHGTFSVKIRPTQKLKTKKDGLRPTRMKIDFIIQKGTKIRTYNQLSGGQQKRLDIAALLALRKLAFLGSGHPTNILILDEVFTGLDDVTQVFDILKESGAESTFIISHKDMPSKYFDSALVAVHNKKGISHLEEEN